MSFPGLQCKNLMETENHLFYLRLGVEERTNSLHILRRFQSALDVNSITLIMNHIYCLADAVDERELAGATSISCYMG